MNPIQSKNIEKKVVTTLRELKSPKKKIIFPLLHKERYSTYNNTKEIKKSYSTISHSHNLSTKTPLKKVTQNQTTKVLNKNYISQTNMMN